MTLKKIKLNPFNIPFLYSDNLIGNSLNNLKKSGEKFNFLGKNTKNLTIIINDKNNVFVSDEDLQFLTKMLLACHYTMEDVAIINIAEKTKSIHTISEILHPKNLILFGVSPNEIDMPIVFPEYHLQNSNQVQCLIAHSLSEIAQDKILKSKLWVCLQKMFNL